MIIIDQKFWSLWPSIIYKRIHVTTGFVTVEFVTTWFVTAEFVTTEFITTELATTEFVTTELATTEFVTAEFVTTEYHWSSKAFTNWRLFSNILCSIEFHRVSLRTRQMPVWNEDVTGSSLLLLLWRQKRRPIVTVSRGQFHQRYTRSFCANSLAPVKYKPKTQALKSCAHNLRT
jgi:hypothetical protein